MLQSSNPLCKVKECLVWPMCTRKRLSSGMFVHKLLVVIGNMNLENIIILTTILRTRSRYSFILRKTSCKKRNSNLFARELMNITFFFSLVKGFS
jgi:hypothetical protein